MARSGPSRRQWPPPEGGPPPQKPPPDGGPPRAEILRSCEARMPTTTRMIPMTPATSPIPVEGCVTVATIMRSAPKTMKATSHLTRLMAERFMGEL
jgi:hypothetical protein